MAAKELRQRPSAALLELDDPFTGWTSIDYRLSEASYVLERDKCPTCGNPVWLCHSANPNIDFEIKVGACYGAAELEDRKKDFPELGAGEYLYAVAAGIENEDKTREPLPSREEALKYI